MTQPEVGWRLYSAALALLTGVVGLLPTDEQQHFESATRERLRSLELSEGPLAKTARGDY